MIPTGWVDFNNRTYIDYCNKAWLSCKAIKYTSAGKACLLQYGMGGVNNFQGYTFSSPTSRTAKDPW